MKKLFFLLTLSAFVACSTFENENPALVDLQGDWSLVEIEGSWFTSPVKMDTANFSIDLKIINNQVSWFYNKKLEKQYSIVKDKVIGTDLALIPAEKDEHFLTYRVLTSAFKSDTLKLLPDCTDCSNQLFVKVKN